MKNFLLKLFGNKTNQSHIEKKFVNIKKNTKVSVIFDAVSSFKNDAEIRYVGGCVRKSLNDEKIDDIDLATNLKPEEIKRALSSKGIKYYETGIEHGTITAVIQNKNFEITSLRKDLKTDGRHAKVEFTNDWKEDASRRDFSINAVYADLNGNIFDPYNGLEDLKFGKINFIGDADKRIKEDYLRILRYIRFFASYSKEEHSIKIKKIIKQNIKGISNLSKDRLISELKKLIVSKSIIKVSTDSFLKELLVLVFPQLINLNKFNKLNKYAKENLEKKDYIFLLALLIIDETDNAEYFLYKYNVSNELKKRITFLKNYYDKGIDISFFTVKNLNKIFYYNDKIHLLDFIDFYLFSSNKSNKKIIDFKKSYENKIKPDFPINTREMMNKYNLSEGKELGQKIKNLESIWVDNNFKISNSEIDRIFSN
tara:strand:+ start:48 stop:1322 length:1275 start_codon:yes stop_codon:yes gene_type:complete